ncbi:hypothetical protein PybrP1_003404 [[Pythium] brassicae (nom. inval.)]|nr:hypothetical protein PybrP1_003404 [[Pythium] brassicae (nom. inval.)]
MEARVTGIHLLRFCGMYVAETIDQSVDRARTMVLVLGQQAAHKGARRSTPTRTMKSVLRGLEQRAQEANAETDTATVSPASQTSSDEAATTHEQLAELKLLSRVELATNALSPPTVVVEPQSNEDGSPHERRDTGRVGKSMFTTLLGSSRALACPEQPLAITTATSLGSSTSSALPSPALSPRSATERFRRASTLPTLCEEPLEEAAPPIEERGGDGMATRVKAAMATATDRRPEVEGDSGEEGDSADDSASESEEEGGAFAQMLTQLAGDFDLLTLAVADITARRLDKVRAALLCGEAAPSAPVSGEPETVEERAESSHPEPPVRSPRSRMRRIRTVVAVDTLRMLLERFGNERISREIASAIRLIFEQYAHESGVEPLRHAPATLTSRNIARVVLQARQALVHDAEAQQLITNRRSPSSPTRQQQRRPTQQQVRTRARTTSTSTEKISVGVSLSSSPHSPTKGVADNGRPLSPQRRSILASEGHHVLMQEKISSFQYRGASSSGLSLFKVRRDGGAEVEAAATRRLKAAAFSKEQARKAGFSFVDYTTTQPSGLYYSASLVTHTTTSPRILGRSARAASDEPLEREHLVRSAGPSGLHERREREPLVAVRSEELHDRLVALEQRLQAHDVDVALARRAVHRVRRALGFPRAVQERDDVEEAPAGRCVQRVRRAAFAPVRVQEPNNVEVPDARCAVHRRRRPPGRAVRVQELHDREAHVARAPADRLARETLGAVREQELQHREVAVVCGAVHRFRRAALVAVRVQERDNVEVPVARSVVHRVRRAAVASVVVQEANDCEVPVLRRAVDRARRGAFRAARVQIRDDSRVSVRRGGVHREAHDVEVAVARRVVHRARGERVAARVQPAHELCIPTRRDGVHLLWRERDALVRAVVCQPVHEREIRRGELHCERHELWLPLHWRRMPAVRAALQQVESLERHGTALHVGGCERVVDVAVAGGGLVPLHLQQHFEHAGIALRDCSVEQPTTPHGEGAAAYGGLGAHPPRELEHQQWVSGQERGDVTPEVGRRERQQRGRGWVAGGRGHRSWSLERLCWCFRGLLGEWQPFFLLGRSVQWCLGNLPLGKCMRICMLIR